MKPKSPPTVNQGDLFRSQLRHIIDLTHPMVQLSHRLDWSMVDREWGACFRSHRGRPALSTRLMAGLMILQHMHDLSDGEVVKFWQENPYWQYFCGMETFQHKMPIHPSSMVRWPKYVGEEGAKKLLRLSIEVAHQNNVVSTHDLRQVNVDTSVQEKAITYPTDSKLYLKALLRVVQLSKANGLVLRQTYTRTAKVHALKAARYAHAKQYQRMNRELRLLKTKLGRVIRDIERQSFDCPKLRDLLSIAKRLHTQQRKDKNKLYSVHAQEVACISKGKAHKRYEFGREGRHCHDEQARVGGRY